MEIITIDNTGKGNPETQLEMALTAFNKRMIERGFHAEKLIRLNVFIKVNSRDQLTEIRDAFSQRISSHYAPHIPAFNIIPQAPLSGDHNIALEGAFVTETKANIERKQLGGHPYVVVERTSCKEVYSGGLSHSETEDFIMECQLAFDLAEQILAKEDLHFGHVIRQWNFVPDILHVSQYGNRNLQHYQIFNDIRGLYYDPALFQQGYPAATGIGCDFGPVTIDFLAAEMKEEAVCKTVHSPLQEDAYHYSEDVLEGDALSGQQKKQAPLFDRAKIYTYDDRARLIVSGTAAIEGESTVYLEDVGNQTKHTIRSILALCKTDNVQKCMPIVDVPRLFETVRVYVKNTNDLSMIRSIVESELPAKNTLYVQADICRDNLLVEIEADLYLHTRL
jgi:enamine deaminase RidA (YjgF/YER057c/UK114 family)